MRGRDIKVEITFKLPGKDPIKTTAAELEELLAVMRYADRYKVSLEEAARRLAEKRKGR